MKNFGMQFRGRIDTTNGTVVLCQEEYDQICKEIFKEAFNNGQQEGHNEAIRSLDGELLQLQKDMRDIEIPKVEGAFNKIVGPNDDPVCEIPVGSKIAWYFLEEKEFWMDEEVEVPQPKDMPYQGIVVPDYGSELRSNSVDFEHAVVVHTQYPVEKCYPDVQWIALKRLLDHPELVKVVVYE